MRHLTDKQIKENKKNFLIANVKGLLKQGNVKEAVKCAKQANLTPEEFAKLESK